MAILFVCQEVLSFSNFYYTLLFFLYAHIKGEVYNVATLKYLMISVPHSVFIVFVFSTDKFPDLFFEVIQFLLIDTLTHFSIQIHVNRHKWGMGHSIHMPVNRDLN